MSFKDEYHPKVKKDLKRLERILVEHFFDHHLKSILRNPYGNEKLHGNLEGVYSYHFKKEKVEYRIGYFINEDKKIIYIVMVGKRENFYEILRRRIKN